MAEIEGLVPHQLVRVIHALREGDDARKSAAARMLFRLSLNDDNQAVIAEAGGVPPLVDLLRDESHATPSASSTGTSSRRTSCWWTPRARR